ncbi:MAG: oligosaccharide flippase family protein [Deferrisomatales bacterium]
MLKRLNRTEDSLRTQSALLFLGHVASFVVQLAVPVLLVRLLSRPEYGVYQLALTVTSTAVLLLGMGLRPSLYYFYPTVGDRKPQVLTQTVYLTVGVATAALGVFLVVLPWVPTEHTTADRLILLQIAGVTYFISISSLIGDVFILQAKALLNAFYLVAEQIVRACFVLVPALLFATVHHALWGLLCFYLLRTAALFLYLRLSCGAFGKVHDFDLVRRQIAYVLPLGGSSLIAVVRTKLDRFLVSGLLGVTPFAAYSVASYNVPVLQMLYHSIFQVAMPRLSRHAAEGEKAAAHALWQTLVEKAALVTLPCVLYMAVMGEQVISLLFTPQYLDALPAYRVFLCVPLVQMMGHGLIARAFGNTRVYLTAGVLALIPAVVLGVTFTKTWGITGAAAAAVISFGLSTSIILRAEKKILGLRFREWFPIRPLAEMSALSVLAMVPVAAFLLAWGALGNVAALAVTAPAYALLVGVLYRLGGHLPVDGPALRSFLRKLYPRQAG